MKKYNYSKLLGRMRERGVTQERLATEIGITEATLSAKLNNKFNFKADEIDSICRVLDISNEEIGEYFFAPKVWKSKQVTHFKQSCIS